MLLKAGVIYENIPCKLQKYKRESKILKIIFFGFFMEIYEWGLNWLIIIMPRYIDCYWV